MAKEAWINLPVKDLDKAKQFFIAIGFEPNPRHPGNEGMASIMVGTTIIMLFPEATLQTFIQHPIANTALGNELIISFDAASREEVDEVARKVEAAGGTLFGPPSEIQGWMYGCGFVDLDGHRWNALYMDMSKMPKG